MLTRPRLARCPRRPGPRQGRVRPGPIRATAKPAPGRRWPGPGRPEPETAGTGTAGPDGEAEFTEDDVAFLSAPQEADAAVAANGTVTEGAPGPDAAPAIGESGRWFRPAKAKKKYVPIPPEDQDGSAGLDVAPADPEPGGAEATQEPAEPDGAVATQEPPEQAAEPRRAQQAEAGAEAEAGEAEAEAERGGGGRGGRGRGRGSGGLDQPGAARVGEPAGGTAG